MKLDEIIEEAKKNHEKIFQVTTTLGNDEERTVILKKPDRFTRSRGEAMAQNDTMKGVETFLRGMYLGGDDLEEICKDDEGLLTIAEGIAEIIAVKPVKLKKL